MSPALASEFFTSEPPRKPLPRDAGESMCIALVLCPSQVVQMVKNLPASAGDIRDEGSIPGLGRSPGGGHGTPLQRSCLENPHGQRSLVDYSPWGRKESDMIEQLSTHTHTHTYTQVHIYTLPLHPVERPSNSKVLNVVIFKLFVNNHSTLA